MSTLEEDACDLLHWQKKHDKAILSEDCEVHLCGMAKLSSECEEFCETRRNGANKKGSSSSPDCPRDDATGIAWHEGKSCESHVTQSDTTRQERRERRITGLIAQEVQEVLPDAVVTTVRK